MNRLPAAFRVALFLIALLSPAHAATIGVHANNGAPGSAVEVQIFLSGGNGLVAGMQTDISWDSNCVSVAEGSGDTGACFGNPSIPKQLSTKLRGSTLRALFFSLQDTEPIKQDAVLFTCTFNVAADTTATECPINLVNVVVSDSKGGRLPVSVDSGVIQIDQSPVPAASAAPGVAPGGSGQEAGEGCAVTGSRPGGCALLWLLGIPLLISGRRWRPR